MTPNNQHLITALYQWITTKKDKPILKDTSKAEDTEAVYEFVEDDEELNLVGKVFEELMDDDVELQQ